MLGEASDGERAVELARSRRPDVVLLDIAMPRLDGLEAARRILRRRRRRRRG
ncbi:response regulator [Nonomuraea sp. NBC_00507]|uniref:response regulator n=1 Tax=Nonomuraea sp. NBC_00507 TaxID=2976002 RepID=UPI002E182B5D